MAGMNWIKFYTGALEENDQLSAILDKFGFEGYGRYWALMGILGKKFNEDCDTITVSSRFLRDGLRFRSQLKLRGYLLASELQAVFNAVEIENDFLFDSSILLDLKSRDFKIARQERKQKAHKRKNKNKEEEKEKNIKKVSLPPSSFADDLINLFNSTCAGVGKIRHCRMLSSDNLRKLMELVKEKPSLRDLKIWEEAFLEAKSNSKLHGLNSDFSIVATLDWFIIESNLLKVLDGKFAGKSAAFSNGDETSLFDFEEYQKKTREFKLQNGLEVNA